MNYYQNFLDEHQSNELLDKLHLLTDWKDFYRNSSHMKEYYGELEILDELRCKLHSKNFIKWIEKETGISGLIVDSFGVGEGVSLMEKNDRLDPHIDFNWNSRINMHRSVNLLIYLGNSSGGEFHVWNEKKDNIIFEKEPLHNSAILFNHSEVKAHGVKPVKSGKRFSIRQFYYKSEIVFDNPHQSLYWYNEKKNMETNSALSL